MDQRAVIEAEIAAYLDAPLTSFRVLDSGWETTIFEFAISAKSRRCTPLPVATPLVLRFYEGSRAHDKAVREVTTLERLTADGYPVPHPYLFETDTRILGAPFVVMERLRGGPLFAISSFPQAFRTFALGFFAFVQTQVRLHRIANVSDRPRAYRADGVPNNAPLLDRLLGLIHDRIGRGPLPGLQAAMDRLKEKADNFRDAPASLLHLDYHPQNVLVNGTRVTGVIDWVSADCGDRHLDAATTSVILATTAMDHPRWMGDNAAGNFLRANFASLYLPLYHAMMPMELARFRYAQGVAALVRLSMFGMMRQRGAAEAGFRDEAMGHLTPSVVRLLSRYATRKIGLPASI